MLVSIVVPAFNEEKLLGPNLAAIQTAATTAWTPLGWDHELIVCDNNSTDRTAAIAADHGAHVVFEPINQIARARNTGTSVARGRWLLFIDADSRPSAALLTDLAAAIATDTVIACGSTLRFPTSHPLLRLGAAAWQTWSRLLRHMAGSFVAVETQAFREVGGFPTDLYVGEELELSRRLQHLGRDRYPAQHIRILTRHPLLTSPRKVELYSLRENLTFALRTFTQPFKVMRNRDHCHLWYDGRR
ncbi:glycosyltransferase [Actomonas aquatica]|uniref:Glycosyltransferase n=1 Tax=Actomonas aquatica TaxID=2866162 RepID=A0ABZ1C402_9BACT|nr:glycosyltransferase [Opitutus sp. WL0086]WRQ86443.1 glycosyltransferase [Opitutus sp. WL0086]